MKFFFSLLLVFSNYSSYSQDFLSAYKLFQQEKIKSDKTLDSIRRTSLNSVAHITRKKIKENKKQRLEFLDLQIDQFDTVFRKYHLYKGFNFDEADSLIIPYQTNIETQLRSFLIISGSDTIKYSERWKMRDIHDFKREIIYDSSFFLTSLLPNYKDASDTILSLILKGDLKTAREIENKYGVLDGATLTIILAKKIMGEYKIDEYFFKPGGLVPTKRE
jgi:hypothetical protein